MRRIISKVIVSISVISMIYLFVSLFSNCEAADVEGKITYVWQLYKPSVFFIELDSGGNVDCKCSTTKRWAVDSSKPEGKAVMAVVLTALSTGKRIRVAGTGNCDVYYDSETVKYILVFPN